MNFSNEVEIRYSCLISQALGFSLYTFYWTDIFIWLLSFRGDWKELEFKEYNFNAKGLPAESGHLHPLLKASIGLYIYQLHLAFGKCVTIKNTNEDISLLNICIKLLML